MRKFLKSLYMEKRKANWRKEILRLQQADLAKINVNMLVVKSKEYCYFAEIAVLSLLAHNPHVRVKIFCDSQTYSEISKRLFREIYSSLVSINLLKDSSESWQRAKIKLILEEMGQIGRAHV